MKLVGGFNIQLWNYLGFTFEVSEWFEGGQIWYAKKQFEELFFSLRINTFSGYALAKIENGRSQKVGNHVVDEKTALEWFSSKSPKFHEAYQSFRKMV
ncbi:hypothetical protein [Polynucleobacter sp. AP-Reno-20A-A9]|uniref:hypothetical protein n=1 Tax=Polynucleobacter sp. AP-Reno-20A-A9 TaxID=2576925 RepID=UPI001C0D8C20|nr:hypothetical protein [Polynucleobacter sp. AP-Reno-20A-A9]MBU3628917.1 hypothetical protein [Polynucleobacter sp. AP-Reno-20A-A9]